MLDKKHVSALQLFKDAQDALVLQASDMSLETISTMVQSKSIDVSPTYQRRERWDLSRQRSLIESFLLNVPVPPVYLFEEDYGTYSVIDGKQRILAIHSFMQGKLQLRDLHRFNLLNGSYFEDIPAGIKNALRVRPYLRVVTLLRQSKDDLKYEVFRRLNEGGEPLNPQEIRNVVFQGPLNELIYDLSESQFLLQQMKIHTQREPAYRQMLNAEVVLRFFVLNRTWTKFSGSFRDSMDRFMSLNKDCNSRLIAQFKGEFERALLGCREIFGRAAFRRPAETGWRDQFLTGMYDAQMVAVAACSDVQIAKAASHRQDIIDRLRSEMRNDKTFEAAVREATNTPSRIRERIKRISALLN